MNSYVTHHGPHDRRPNSYVTSPTNKSQRSGCITLASHTGKAGSYIDADTLHSARR